VMGSKRLKAVVVRGTSEVPVFDPEKLRPIAMEWTRLATEAGLGVLVKQAGAPRAYGEGLLDGLVGLSAKNWRANTLPGFGHGMTQQKITPKPCYRCPIGCCYDAEVLTGPYKGYVATLSGGGENTEGAASIVGAGASDPGEVWYLTDLEDRLGFETSSIGCAMAVAFEAFEKGLLTTKDTDGLELKWGDGKVIETLVKRIAHKEGKFATMLADGPKAAAERVGLPDAAVHIKGAGMNLHDWRRAWGVLLGQAVGGGSGWPPPGADCWTPEADAGYPERTDPLSPFGKGQEVAKTGIIKLWNDCYGCCWFGTWGLPGIMKFSANAVAAVVGWEDFTLEEALAVGHRVLTLERIFNMKNGLTAEDDLDVSPRITDPAPADAGPAAGKSIKPYLEGWVRDYYVELGWDRRTGKPMKATMKKLGLEEFIN
jgi:aldehyde:ferredoxin oxidoreductase